MKSVEICNVIPTFTRPYRFEAVLIDDFSSVEEAFKYAYVMAKELNKTQSGMVILGGSYDQLMEFPSYETLYYDINGCEYTEEMIDSNEDLYESIVNEITKIVHNSDNNWTHNYSWLDDTIMHRIIKILVPSRETLYNVCEHMSKQYTKSKPVWEFKETTND